MIEEIATVELNYAEICALMESGTVEINSILYGKLRAARDRFTKPLKVYGNGYGFSSDLKVIESGASELSAREKIIVKEEIK